MGAEVENQDVFSKSAARQIDAPTAAIIKSVYKLWLSKADGGLPSRQDMGAATLGELMPYVYIVDVLEDAQDFQMRFMGSAVIQSVGQDYTGIKTSDNEGHEALWRKAVYRLVYKERKPIFTRVSLSDFERGHIVTECALLPLNNSAGECSMILCCAVPV